MNVTVGAPWSCNGQTNTFFKASFPHPVIIVRTAIVFHLFVSSSASQQPFLFSGNSINKREAFVAQTHLISLRSSRPYAKMGCGSSSKEKQKVFVSMETTATLMAAATISGILSGMDKLNQYETDPDHPYMDKAAQLWVKFAQSIAKAGKSSLNC